MGNDFGFLHHNGDGDAQSCALFFVCTSSSAASLGLCVSFASLSALSFIGATAMLWSQVAAPGRRCGCRRGSLVDPITSVGAADGALAGALLSGATVGLARKSRLTPNVRDGLFHLAYSAFLVAIAAGFLSARQVYNRVAGATSENAFFARHRNKHKKKKKNKRREHQQQQQQQQRRNNENDSSPPSEDPHGDDNPSPAPLGNTDADTQRRRQDQHSSNNIEEQQDPAVSVEPSSNNDEDYLDYHERPTLDGDQDDGSFRVSSLTEAQTEKCLSRGHKLILIWLSAAAFSVCIHLTERRGGGAANAAFTGLAVTATAALGASSISAAKAVADAAGRSYPREELAKVRTTVGLLVLAYAAKIAFVALAVVIAFHERVFAGCEEDEEPEKADNPDKRESSARTTRPVARALMELAWAITGALDAFAYFSTVEEPVVVVVNNNSSSGLTDDDDDQAPRLTRRSRSLNRLFLGLRGGGNHADDQNVSSRQPYPSPQRGSSGGLDDDGDDDDESQRSSYEQQQQPPEGGVGRQKEDERDGGFGTRKRSQNGGGGQKTWFFFGSRFFRRRSDVQVRSRSKKGHLFDPTSELAPWARAVAPLHLAAIDEAALRDAEVIGRGAFGAVRKVDARRVVLANKRLSDLAPEARVAAVKNFAPYENNFSENDDDDDDRDQIYGDDNLALDTWFRDQLELLRREAFQVATLTHRRIVQLYGIAESSRFGPCLVSEYCDGGSVHDAFKNENPVSNFVGRGFRDHEPWLARRAASHVADAMAYLHSKGVIHRDLKSANVLVDALRGRGTPMNWRFKVADFGTSRVILDLRRRRDDEARDGQSGHLKDLDFGFTAWVSSLPRRVFDLRRRRRRRNRRGPHKRSSKDESNNAPDHQTTQTPSIGGPHPSNDTSTTTSPRPAALTSPVPTAAGPLPPPALLGFGLMKQSTGPAAPLSPRMLTTQVGTPLYMSPELIAGVSDYDHTVDVYSYGVLCWELAARATAWYDGDPGPACSILFHKVTVDQLRPPLHDWLDPALVDVMTRAWRHDASERPSFDEIYRDLDRLRGASGTSSGIHNANGLATTPHHKQPAGRATTTTTTTTGGGKNVVLPLDDKPSLIAGASLPSTPEVTPGRRFDRALREARAGDARDDGQRRVDVELGGLPVDETKGDNVVRRPPADRVLV